MKIVLRHKTTGRYYDASGQWVRRADNALAFDDLSAAHEFTRIHHIQCTQAVQRLAPYMAALLRSPRRPMWDLWMRRRSLWYAARAGRFSHN